MHIYFSGIGGAGIGPLAQIAIQAGYQVSGSDKQDSDYIEYLKASGIAAIHIGQDRQAIAAIHQKQPIDWFVYSSALTFEQPHPAELQFCQQQGIKISKRDELLKTILSDKRLKMLAIAGTQGKTTTTALCVWLMKQLQVPISYLLPAKVSFGQMGEYNPQSQYFIYEADEFDRNFLAFEPQISAITGVSWDHHEIFPTRENYKEAFRDFIGQSEFSLLWQEDADYLGFDSGSQAMTALLDPDDSAIRKLKLLGLYNRRDAWLAINAVQHIVRPEVPLVQLMAIADAFPGLSRRMELLQPHLYTDYAHTPEKIRGAMSVALDMAEKTGQQIIVVYEPLTNRRQHYLHADYKDCFAGAQKVYWLPSYLARENTKQRIIPPEELIAELDDPEIAVAIKKDAALKTQLRQHLAEGAMVVGMAGGGGNSLDSWLRENFG